MPSVRQRLTVFTLSFVAVLAVGLVGGSPAVALDVDGRLCPTSGSARFDVGGIRLGVGERGAQDDCVRFTVEQE